MRKDIGDIYENRFVSYYISHFLYLSNLPFSVTGAVLLSLGSVLLWAVIRSIVPPSPACCTIAGIGTGVAFLKIGSSYLEFVDQQIAKK